MMNEENVANAAPRRSSGGGLGKSPGLKSPVVQEGERRRSRRLSGAR